MLGGVGEMKEKSIAERTVGANRHGKLSEKLRYFVQQLTQRDIINRCGSEIQEVMLKAAEELDERDAVHRR